MRTVAWHWHRSAARASIQRGDHISLTRATLLDTPTLDYAACASRRRATRCRSDYAAKTGQFLETSVSALRHRRTRRVYSTAGRTSRSHARPRAARGRLSLDTPTLDSRLAAPGTVRVAGHSPVQNRNAIREKRRRQFSVTSIPQKHVRHVWTHYFFARSSITSVLVVAVKDTMRE